MQYQNVEGFEILKEVYGDAMTITMETIIQQLAFVKKSFPGLDLALLDYFLPVSFKEYPFDLDFAKQFVVKTSNDKAMTAVLVQLTSLHHLPNLYVHDADVELKQFNTDTISKFHDSFSVLKTDFSFRNHSLKMGPDFSGENSENDALKFEEVVAPDISTLLI